MFLAIRTWRDSSAERPVRREDDHAPVLAITGQTYHDLMGMQYQQEVDLLSLFKDVAVYNQMVLGAGTSNRAWTPVAVRRDRIPVRAARRSASGAGSDDARRWSRAGRGGRRSLRTADASARDHEAGASDG